MAKIFVLAVFLFQVSKQQEYFDKAGLVFAGKVEAIKNSQPVEVTLEVTQEYKGLEDKIGKTITVRASNNLAKAEKGELWIVYANIASALNTDTELEIFLVSRDDFPTSSWKNADRENLLFLTQLKKPVLRTKPK